MTTKELEISAKRVRQSTLAMGYFAGGTHFAPSFSIADILAVLYGAILHINSKNINSDDRDRFVLSKGHASAALLSILAEKEIIDKKTLKKYCQIGSHYGGHLDRLKVEGVEASTGSLGHGFGMACGIAYAAKLQNKKFKTYTILGDGECQEGSIWESAMSASNLKLDNLVAIIDYNKLQGMGFTSEICNMEPFVSKWESFGWSVMEIDGHNIRQIYDTLSNVPFQKNQPSAVVAHTIKGKGVSFMENKDIWHYRLPNEEELKIACCELEIQDINKVLS